MQRKWISTIALILILSAISSCSKDDAPELLLPEYVDLGLPSGVKWATFNVGASSPEEYGDYFAWGEISPKDSYTIENSLTYEKEIGDIAGNPEYDVARANWGGSWRLPTKTELEELKTECTWTLTTMGNHVGYKVTGPNGNYIFLPAAGFRGPSFYSVGECGYYWTSSPDESYTQVACALYFYSGYHSVDGFSRRYGISVRPVSE